MLGPEAGGKRDVLEARLVSRALQLLRLKTDVVLDFGCWARDARSALRWLAEQEAAAFRLVYLTVARGRQLQRIQQRWQDDTHHTLPMSVPEIDSWCAQFEVPDDELTGGPVPPPPTPCTTWLGREPLALSVDLLTFPTPSAPVTPPPSGGLPADAPQAERSAGRRRRRSPSGAG